jgi:hypothetical protein
MIVFRFIRAPRQIHAFSALAVCQRFKSRRRQARSHVGR